MIAHGMTRRAIAHELGITLKTAREHVFEAMKRLDAPTVASAVWLARRQLEAAGG